MRLELDEDSRGWRVAWRERKVKELGREVLKSEGSQKSELQDSDFKAVG